MNGKRPIIAGLVALSFAFHSSPVRAVAIQLDPDGSRFLKDRINSSLWPAKDCLAALKAANKGVLRLRIGLLLNHLVSRFGEGIRPDELKMVAMAFNKLRGVILAVATKDPAYLETLFSNTDMTTDMNAIKSDLEDLSDRCGPGLRNLLMDAALWDLTRRLSPSSFPEIRPPQLAQAQAFIAATGATMVTAFQSLPEDQVTMAQVGEGAGVAAALGAILYFGGRYILGGSTAGAYAPAVLARGSETPIGARSIRCFYKGSNEEFARFEDSFFSDQISTSEDAVELYHTVMTRYLPLPDALALVHAPRHDLIRLYFAHEKLKYRWEELRNQLARGEKLRDDEKALYDYLTSLIVLPEPTSRFQDVRGYGRTSYEMVMNLAASQCPDKALNESQF